MSPIESAVTLAPLAPSPPSTEVEAGVDGLVVLVPVAEPISRGAPPVAPRRINRAAVAREVRSVRSEAGTRKTSGLDTAPRVTFSVGWPALTAAERASLDTFLTVDMGGTRDAMDLLPDGPGGETVTVRPITDATWELLDGAAGVWSCAVECEEVTL